MFNTPDDRLEAILDFTTGQLCIPELYAFAEKVIAERYTAHFNEFFENNPDMDEDDMNAFTVARAYEKDEETWLKIFGCYDDEVYDLFYEVKRQFDYYKRVLGR